MRVKFAENLRLLENIDILEGFFKSLSDLNYINLFVTSMYNVKGSTKMVTKTTTRRGKFFKFLI